MKRNLSFDPQSGISTDFTYEAGETLADDHFIISTSQDVTKIIEANKRSEKEVDARAKWGEFSKVASIPLTIYYDLKAKGIVDDEKRLKRWLNDSDNKFFRTRGGTI
jgi:phage-related protein|tara:strand:+ start:14 stop:334 length:321 start_codon:yes stop_codon:yes gene_type:complete